MFRRNAQRIRRKAERQRIVKKMVDIFENLHPALHNINNDKGFKEIDISKEMRKEKRKRITEEMVEDFC